MSFEKLLSIATPDHISDELLNFFLVRLYPKTYNTKEVNSARNILFYKDKKVVENIATTKAELRQHVSDQSLDLQSGDSFCVQTLLVGILANGIDKK